MHGPPIHLNVAHLSGQREGAARASWLQNEAGRETAPPGDKSPARATFMNFSPPPGVVRQVLRVATEARVVDKTNTVSPALFQVVNGSCGEETGEGGNGVIEILTRVGLPAMLNCFANAADEIPVQKL
ncbi:hypothetical protein BaRGS_00003957 [Batillaria attramentaria]|uniref:Uncharacterized protein n=1 Tax=Batillaria attramentaria TaxID=370345 RepID=A0ABD0LZM3_9CAEN